MSRAHAIAGVVWCIAAGITVWHFTGSVPLAIAEAAACAAFGVAGYELGRRGLP